MSTLRFEALKIARNREVYKFESHDDVQISYGKNVFNETTMAKFLPKNIYSKVINCLKNGSKIDRNLADGIAKGMKDWALSQNITHYTHWFQPLTGLTAEKHNSFFSISHISKSPIDSFGGNQLVQQESDASSFPSGGIRNTFEARGYTAWDPTSPAFIYGRTLCIPSVFISYTGEALDYKIPLLRSLEALDKSATLVGKIFDSNLTCITPVLGWEQEYFLIDNALANSRLDILATGRTLIGHAPPKGQQLNDHYLGSIPTRAMNYMRDLENDCMLLGIPIRTRHNEVAPNQFEFAHIYEETNLAVDHNSLMLELMQKVAERHNFKVLLHEKPFKGVNGSGKHCNWSLATNSGKNLLNPSSSIEFLTFLINVITAISKYEVLIRASVANLSNDCRLGAHEAPPAIISVFVGKRLTELLEDLEGISKNNLSDSEKADVTHEILKKIPDVFIDNTDRNRTSPFAFTGNKFEFRAVGSSANIANSMTVLNTIVAKQLKDFKSEFEETIVTSQLNKDDVILNILRKYIKDFKRILFEGDGYSKDWETEANERGLSVLKNTPRALKAKMNVNTYSLFEEMGVLTRKELDARYQIELEEYIKKLHIEFKVLTEICHNKIIPSSLKYQNLLIQNVKGIREVLDEGICNTDLQLNLIKKTSECINEIKDNLLKMNEEIELAENMDVEEKAIYYAEKIYLYFAAIRDNCDFIESIVDDEMWELVKYEELLFIK